MAIINASTCSVFGPGKFLRGKGGIKAAEEVVKVLEDKSEPTLYYFYYGLFCIVLSSALKAFIQYSILNALLVTCGLVFITYLLYTAGNRIVDEMYVAKDKAITGRIDKNQIHDPTNVQIN